MPIRSLCKKAWNQPLALAVDRPGGLSPPKGPAPSEAVRLALRTLVRRTADALLLCAAMAAALHGLQLDRAQELYQRTQYREALRLLEASREKTAAIYDLLGKCYYRLEEFSKATDAFEKAVEAEPRNALFWNWLGKAYGRRAETSVFFNAPRYAVRAREHFEKAVALDPQNREALSDLFEYYLEAPGFLGGGLEKAADLSERIRNLDPARYPALEHEWKPEYMYIPSAPGTITQITETIEELSDSIDNIDFKQISEEIEKLVVSLNKTVEDAKVGELSKDLKELIKSLNSTVTELDTILKSNDAKQTLANVTAITSDLRTTLNRTDRLLSSREHSLKLTMENIERVTEDARELMDMLKKYPSWVLFGNPPPHIEGEDKAE